jgi:Transposase domain (DUF772)
MSMKNRSDGHQDKLWTTYDEVTKSPGHPFYDKLEHILREEGFDAFVEGECAPFYAKKQGRPSIPPGVYSRMLMIGYFERIDSERGICWRCADSLSLRRFLGVPLDEDTRTIRRYHGYGVGYHWKSTTLYSDGYCEFLAPTT